MPAKTPRLTTKQELEALTQWVELMTEGGFTVKKNHKQEMKRKIKQFFERKTNALRLQRPSQ